MGKKTLRSKHSGYSSPLFSPGSYTIRNYILGKKAIMKAFLFLLEFSSQVYTPSKSNSKLLFGDKLAYTVR